jgi:uncharacterized membrane protein YidH (DUF202 family)
MRWKLAALAFLAIAVILILIAPLATVKVTIDLPPGTSTTTPQAVNDTATLVVSIVVGAFAVAALGVLAWVARHILRRRHTPDA